MKYLLVISGQIGGYYSGVSAGYVRYMLNQNKDKDVHIGFCSLGGSVKDGLEMYQAFKDHGNVYAHAFGMNASISTIAMLGCKSIDIVKGSFFLIHNVSTYIDIFDRSNKEQLDDYIKKMQAERENLKTMDDVLAQMYADKCKKPASECAAQMKKGNWMTAQQALEFGLVDSLREDKEAEAISSKLKNGYTNSYNTIIFKDAGIPPLPSVADSEPSRLAQAVADENGNPTQSFLQKTWQGLQSLLRNQHADKTNDNMIKVFNSVMTLLNMPDGFASDDKGNISLSQEQMKAIDARLTALENAAKTDADAIQKAGEALTKTKDELKTAQETIKQRDSQIANLKGAPGAEPDTKDAVNAGEAFTAQDLFNLVKDV